MVSSKKTISGIQANGGGGGWWGGSLSRVTSQGQSGVFTGALSSMSSSSLWGSLALREFVVEPSSFQGGKSGSLFIK